MWVLVGLGLSILNLEAMTRHFERERRHGSLRILTKASRMLDESAKLYRLSENPRRLPG